MDKKYYSDENSAELIDSAFYYDGNDLGLTLNGTSASFKCWAPTASNVRLLLLKDSAAKKICAIKQMERKEKGVWFFSGSYEGCSYYQYEISFGTEVFKVADI